MIIDEVLKQYFFVVDPSRIDQVPNLVRTNKNCIEDLCKTLQKEYGLNPLAPLTYKDVKEWKKMKYGNKRVMIDGTVVGWYTRTSTSSC